MRHWLLAVLFSVFLPHALGGGSSSGKAASFEENTYTNSIGMEFALIPAGSFLRDDIVVERNESGEAEDQYRPRMTISKPFYLGKYVVTQEQWAEVMGSGSNPGNTRGSTKPVEGILWMDVQEFITLLNKKEGTDKYRLPTEVEWELAARGGTDTVYFFMEDPASQEAREAWMEAAERALNDYAWFIKNSRGANPVGQKKPNPYGLYDIYGNVWEWVQDEYAKLPADREIPDYPGPDKGVFHVVRGGAWYLDAKENRSGSRDHDLPSLGRGCGVPYRIHSIGFRVAFSIE